MNRSFQTHNRDVEMSNSSNTYEGKYILDNLLSGRLK